MDDEIETIFSEKDIPQHGSTSRFMTKLFSTFQNKEYVFLAMEYLSGGDLFFHLQAEGRFTKERARFYSAEVILGLQFLHSHGIIHRDLKLENVLLTAGGHIKLVNLGTAKVKIRNSTRTTTVCRTPANISPEMLTGLPYGGSVDWWCLGILLFQMTAGRSPFDHQDDDILFNMIQHRQLCTPSTFSKESKDIIRDLLEKDT